MPFTATQLYERLSELDNDDTNPFSLRDGVSESDVQAWYDSVDIAALESDADAAIDRVAVTDLTAAQDIGSEELSVADVIRSRNDDPADYEGAYLIRADRTVVQYFKPRVGGREPIPAADVEAWMGDHVSEMVNRAVNAILLDRARTEFRD